MKLLWKSLSYRAISLAITSSAAFMVTGSLSMAMSLGGGDALVNIVAYALHEKAREGAGTATA